MVFKKKEVEKEEEVVVVTPKTEKELLTECYEFMKSRGVNSIGDIENKIARS